jgi:hypothetical protein
MLDMEEEEYRHLPPDLSLLEEFNAVMKRTVPLFDVEERAKKRRKVTVNVEDINKKDIMDEPIRTPMPYFYVTEYRKGLINHHSFSFDFQRTANFCFFEANATKFYEVCLSILL